MIELYRHGSSVCAAKVRFALGEKKLTWQGHYLDILAGGVWPINSTSCIGLAFLHKTALCRATQGLTITAYRLRFTSVFLALLNECGLGGPRERLSILADGLSLHRHFGPKPRRPEMLTR